MNVIAGFEPKRTARLSGALYLVTIVSGVTGLILHDKAAAISNLVAGLAYMAVTVLFFYLFRPVSRSVSVIAGLFSILGFLGDVFNWEPFGADSLVFFGVYCVLIAYLIARSNFLPLFLAFLMAFAGLNWLTFVSPYLIKRMHPYNLYPGLIGEGALTLWLLIVGVNVKKWNEQAGRA